MITSQQVSERWGRGEMSDVEALMVLCGRHAEGCKDAFFVINAVVIDMNDREIDKTIDLTSFK